VTEVEFEFSLRPNDDPELGRYVIGFIGKAMTWDEAAGCERTIAEIRGHRLDLAGAEYDGVGKDLLLDSICPEISEFSQAVLHDQGCHFIANLADGRRGRQACSGLIYINELRVDDAFRGQQIGRQLIGKIGQMVDVKDCVIALKAFPLSKHLGQKVPLEQVHRLKRFYQRLGFSPAGDEFMVKPANQCETIQKRMAWRRQHPAHEIAR
jgi:GNAT superfamily N-acetyltransferase